MVMDKGALRIRDSPFNRLQLLGNFRTWPACLDHFYHRAQVAVGPLQAGNHSRVACMPVLICHREKLSSLGGCGKVLFPKIETAAADRDGCCIEQNL